MIKLKKQILSLVFIPILISCNGKSESATPFSFIETNQGIELTENGKTAFFYQRNAKSLNGSYERNNYIHPLYNLEGEVLTEDFPDDHPHHRGIFWAWHQIYIGDSLISDSWSLENFATIITEVKTEVNANSAKIFIDAKWTSPIFQNNKPYLEEKTQITLHKQKNNLRFVDFRIELKALVKNLRIGGADNEKGYGGFSLRIKMPDNLKFVGKDGSVTPQNLQIDAGPWMDFSASFAPGNELNGVTLLSDPNYPGIQQKWILRQKNSMQNIVFPGQYPLDVQVGKQMVLHYRLVIHNGSAVKTDIDKWYFDYLSVQSDTK